MRKTVRTAAAVAKAGQGGPGYDGNAPEFRAVKDHIYVDGKRQAVDGPQNVNTTRIDWLHAHDEIDARQFEAARRLYRDWYKSQIQTFASAVLVGAGGGGASQLPNDVKVQAMKAHGAALQSLGYGAPIVRLVVEEDLTVGKAAACLRVGEKQAKGMLWLALHMLADHYRLPRARNDEEFSKRS
jgi:hypothetical protein